MDPARPDAGQRVRLDAQVRNQGNASAGAFRVAFLVDGTEVAHADLPGLAAGAQQDVLADWTARDGAKKLVAVADSGRAVREADEGNNQAELTLPSLGQLPDLVVEDLELTATPKAGSTAQLSAEVANTGSAGSPPTKVRFTLDGQGLGEVDVPALAPDAHATVLSPGFTATSGAHHVGALVDPDNAIAELSEDNARTLDFSVGGKVSATAVQARVAGLRTEPADLVAGKQADAIALVRNDGSQVQGGLTVRLRVDGVPAAQGAVPDLAPGESLEVRIAFTPSAGVHTLRAELLAQGTPVGAPTDLRVRVQGAGSDPLLPGIVLLGGLVVLLGAVGYRRAKPL
jgi:subtilase family serine protease